MRKLTAVHALFGAMSTVWAPANRSQQHLRQTASIRHRDGDLIAIFAAFFERGFGGD